MKLRALAIPVLVALSLALAACGGSDDSTERTSSPEITSETEPKPNGEAARSEKVKIVEFAFGPDPVVVKTGGKVIWQNEDSAPHTATADDGSFDTGTLEKGKIKSASFKDVGTYPYFCEIHPTMHGTVEVVE